MNARLAVSASHLAVGVLGPQSWAAVRQLMRSGDPSSDSRAVYPGLYLLGPVNVSFNVVKSARCDSINLFRHVSIAGHLDILRFGLSQKGLLETSCACLLV